MLSPVTTGRVIEFQKDFAGKAAAPFHWSTEERSSVYVMKPTVEIASVGSGKEFVQAETISTQMTDLSAKAYSPTVAS